MASSPFSADLVAEPKHTPPAKASLVPSSRDYPQIYIGGSARVHLGDQNISGQGREVDSAHDEPEKEESDRYLRGLSQALRFIEFATKVLSTGERSCSSDDILDLLISADHIRIACRSLTSFRSALRTHIEWLSQDASRSGHVVFIDVLKGCMDAAKSLSSSLQETWSTSAGTNYHDLRQMIERTCSEDDIHQILELLRDLQAKSVLCLLLLTQ